MTKLKSGTKKQLSTGNGIKEGGAGDAGDAGDAIFQISSGWNLNNRPKWEDVYCEVFERLAVKLTHEIIRKANNFTTTYKGFKLTFIDDRKEFQMNRELIYEYLDSHDGEIDFNDMCAWLRDAQEAHDRWIEEREEEQHSSGFYASQDTLNMYRRER